MKIFEDAGAQENREGTVSVEDRMQGHKEGMIIVKRWRGHLSVGLAIVNRREGVHGGQPSSRGRESAWAQRSSIVKREREHISSRITTVKGEREDTWCRDVIVKKETVAMGPLMRAAMWCARVGRKDWAGRVTRDSWVGRWFTKGPMGVFAGDLIGM
ncbi:hypothetical protein TIFTF001_009784 [Ficus carica]|uniref:Uncharacterized protein n=1 Tax=Ficus carica TaxID=3494 RepID=A0AA87ZX13_FICCA|nr:hypothetical protein TIFTF001_009784 [Ficus carica]